MYRSACLHPPKNKSAKLLKTTGRPHAAAASVVAEGGKSSPLRLELLEHLALRVVADNARVDEAAQVELLGPKHRHLRLVSRGCRRLAAWFSDVPLHTTVTAMGKDFGIGCRLSRDAESADGVTCRLQLTSPLSGIAIKGPFRALSPGKRTPRELNGLWMAFLTF